MTPHALFVYLRNPIQWSIITRPFVGSRSIRRLLRFFTRFFMIESWALHEKRSPIATVNFYCIVSILCIIKFVDLACLFPQRMVSPNLAAVFIVGFIRQNQAGHYTGQLGLGGLERWCIVFIFTEGFIFWVVIKSIIIFPFPFIFSKYI